MRTLKFNYLNNSQFSCFKIYLNNANFLVFILKIKTVNLNLHAHAFFGPQTFY
jgi:hypothetical protein